MDEKGRQTVYSFLQNTSLPWLAPVGRLDKASEGLLLFTNDHEWAEKILNPNSHILKTYHVQITGGFDANLGHSCVNGIKSGTDFLRAHSVSLLRKGTKNCWLEIVLDEGKNREIRRMLEHLDRQILRLIRVSIGGIALGVIPKGQYRLLTSTEAQLLPFQSVLPEKAVSPQKCR